MAKQKDWSMKEKDLFLPIKQYFEKLGFLVGAEVPAIGYSVCDVGAVCGDVAIAIELKMSLTEKLLHQCYNHTLLADAVYAAVPTNPKSLEKYKKYGIGVLQVKDGKVKMLLDSRMDYSTTKKYKFHFIEETIKAAKYKNIAGLPNMKGTGPRIECQKRIDKYIKKVGYIPSWKELWENVDNHYCNPSSMGSVLKK